jgi:predicted RNA-binding Zn-ribbon protein involved in translation (DUF1610 family)
MSVHTTIDPRAAVAMKSSADEAVLAWTCPACGQVRVFEGGRPTRGGVQDECPTCGNPLADLSEGPPAPVRARGVRALDRMLL